MSGPASDAEPAAAHLGDSIRRNAAFALASQAATAAFTALITVFLVRELGPEEYGLWSIALGFAGLVILAADFGISQSAARFIAERRGRPQAVAAVLAESLRLKLLLTSAFAAGLIVLAEPIAGLYDAPELAWPIRGVALAMLGQSFLFTFAKSFVAMGRISWQLRLYVSEGALEASATIALVLLAGGATAAAFGRAIGYLGGALLGAIFLARLLGRRAIEQRSGGAGVRRLASYAGAMLVIDAAFGIFSQLDVLFVGALLGASAAGIYAAPVKLAFLMHYPGLSLGQAIAPRLARHPDHPPEVGAFRRGMRYLILLQTALATVIAVWAGPIVELVLGSEYDGSVDVLRALAPFVFLQGMGPLVSTSVNYLGEARRRVPIAIGCVLLNLVLVIVLIEGIGVTGAAFAVDISYGVYVLAHLWICGLLLEVRFRELLETLARVVPAAAALAAVLLAAGTENIGAGGWIAGGLGGGLAYATGLLLTRAVTRSELRGLAREARRRLKAG